MYFTTNARSSRAPVDGSKAASSVSTLGRFARFGLAALLSLACFADQASAQSEPYTDVGGGLAGTNGIPVLEGFGSLYPGTVTMLRMTSAQPQSYAVLSLSLAYGNTPAFGGTSHTLPSTLTLESTTDLEGMAEFPITIPPGFPALDFWVEVFVVDAGAPQGVAITNTVKGSSVSASVIPDAAVFFDSVRTECFNLASQGHIAMDLFTILNSNAAYYELHPEEVLNLITPMKVREDGTDVPQGPGPGGPTGGGNTPGGKWIWENIFGMDIATASLSVPWTGDTCKTRQGTVALGGGMPLGTMTAHQVGNKWNPACPPKEQCPSGTSRECGNYQICWRQTFVWFLTLSSGCTTPEVICSPCP